MSEPEEAPVPKLPRGRGLKLSGPELVRIAITLISLIGVIVLARPCASSVSSFVMGYSQGSASSKLPKPGNVEPATPIEDYSQYEQLKAGMSDEEIKAAIERSKAKNVAAKGSAGSGARSGSSAP